MITKVSILGVGLIGGSLAKALKRKMKGHKRAFYLIGWGRSAKKVSTFSKKGLVDLATTDFEVAVSDADIVVLAVPVQHMKTLAHQIRPYLKQGAIVTDVGSVKQQVLKDLGAALPSHLGVSVVGSHPMAGGEQSGLEFAKDNLFEKAACVVTTDGASKSAQTVVRRLWESVGARVYFMSARQHDKTVAAISHLPHVLAFALFSQVKDLSKVEKNILSLVAGSFQDMTRIAASDADVWTGILDSNRAEIKSVLNKFNSLSKNLLSLKGQKLTQKLREISLSKQKAGN